MPQRCPLSPARPRRLAAARRKNLGHRPAVLRTWPLFSPAPRTGPIAFLVDLDDATVSRQRFRDPGLRPVGRGAITLDDTFVPDDRLLGEEGRGFSW